MENLFVRTTENEWENTADNEWVGLAVIVEALPLVSISDLFGSPLALLAAPALSAVVSLSDSRILVVNHSSFLAADKTYTLTLTGSADALSDIDIPYSFFQIRVRQGGPSFVQAVTIGADYAAEISDRANGELVVRVTFVLDGAEWTEDIASVPMEEIDIAGNGIVLSGHSTPNAADPATVLMVKPTETSVEQGKTKFRFTDPYPYVRPGDTVSIGAASFEVAAINITRGKARRFIEISEAA